MKNSAVSVIVSGKLFGTPVNRHPRKKKSVTFVATEGVTPSDIFGGAARLSDAGQSG
jgi:hypothetical protein